MIYVLLGVISHNGTYTPRKLRCVMRLRILFGYLKHPSTWFCMPSQSLWSDPPIGSVRVRPVRSRSHQSPVYGWSPPYNMRLPIVCSKDISTIWGGFFKWWSHLIRVKSYGLRSGCLSYKVGGTLEEMERVKYKSYGLGTGGQTGFTGSSVAVGRSLRAWR